jgi:quinol monooxygenase YgiN
MVKHIVMWRMAGPDRAAQAAELKARLEALPAIIAEIEQFEVGINTVESDAASEVVLISAFADWAALRTYQAHPDHQAVAAFLKDAASERRVVDYEA